MKEQLISFETAKLAKEKGFNIEVKTYFDIKKFGDKPCEFYGRLNANDYNSWDDKLKKNINAGYISAPTQSLLQKWFREVHNCHVEVVFHSPLDDSYITKDNLRYCFEVNYYGKNFNIPFTDDEDYSGYDYLTYEEA